PADLDILSSGPDLPALPSFAINLHLPKHGIEPAAREFARYIRDGLVRRPVAA
ncbi:MAG: LysR family transcriptional regulator, partial [Mesorhizobium sp.]